jgi:hypothetical protein
VPFRTAITRSRSCAETSGDESGIAGAAAIGTSGNETTVCGMGTEDMEKSIPLRVLMKVTRSFENEEFL